LKVREIALDRRLIVVEGVTPFELASECPAESVASGDTFAPSARCGAEFFSEQEREKSVFPAAALMRFEE
jgi:hypothetical protein